jgi:hypothetical protein
MPPFCLYYGARIVSGNVIKTRCMIDLRYPCCATESAPKLNPSTRIRKIEGEVKMTRLHKLWSGFELDLPHRIVVPPTHLDPHNLHGWNITTDLVPNAEINITWSRGSLVWILPRGTTSLRAITSLVAQRVTFIHLYLPTATSLPVSFYRLYLTFLSASFQLPSCYTARETSLSISLQLPGHLCSILSA